MVPGMDARRLGVMATLVLVACEGAPRPAASSKGQRSSLEAAFESAGREYQVPVELLKGIGWVETRLSPQANLESASGGLGLMQLPERGDWRLQSRAQTLTGATRGKVAVDPAANVRGAAAVLRELFVAGAFPRNFATIQNEEVATWMQNGRAAFNYASMGRTQIYNDPARSQFPGKLKTVPIPVSRDLLGKYAVAPAKVEFWGMGIPKNARNKEQAWDLIRAMSSKESTVMTAINGNGPVRASAYEDARVKQKLSYAEEEKKVLLVARAPMPAFDQAQRAADFFKEEAEAAVLGMKTPQKAMDDLAARVKPLLL
jgi:ABC-type glycerol-3-phosphate transport system substrate-binding protein